MIRSHPVEVLWTIGEMAGLPLGTRIATNTNMLLTLDVGYGSQFWMEDGQLTPYSPTAEWLPVFVLPPVVKGEEEWPGS